MAPPQWVATSAAPVKTATVPAETKKPAEKLTIVEAKIDVGLGNTLYLRGQGGGLSWNTGVPLTCIDSKTWRWTTRSPEKLTFKLLLNDSIWAQGKDIVVSPGKRVEVVPVF